MSTCAPFPFLTCRLPIRVIVENTTSQTLAPVFSRWRCFTFISSRCFSEPSQLTGLGSRNKNGPRLGNIYGTCCNLDPRPFTLQSAIVRGKNKPETIPLSYKVKSVRLSAPMRCHLGIAVGGVLLARRGGSIKPPCWPCLAAPGA